MWKETTEEEEKMNENKEKTAGNLANSVVEGYDYSVAVRMSGRAGAYSPTGGKGNAFEVMYSNPVSCDIRYAV